MTCTISSSGTVSPPLRTHKLSQAPPVLPRKLALRTNVTVACAQSDASNSAKKPSPKRAKRLVTTLPRTHTTGARFSTGATCANPMPPTSIRCTFLSFLCSLKAFRLLVACPSRQYFILLRSLPLLVLRERQRLLVLAHTRQHQPSPPRVELYVFRLQSILLHFFFYESLD